MKPQKRKFSLKVERFHATRDEESGWVLIHGAVWAGLSGIGLAARSSVERELLASEPDVKAGEADSLIGSHGQAALVPRHCTLSGFALEPGCSEGIAIQSLAPGTTLIVQTRNSQYRLIVLNGERHGVLVQGGALLPEATLAHLQGASAGGSVVKTGWIGVGLCMELSVGPQRIITSPVRSITIENVPPRLYRFPHYA